MKLIDTNQEWYFLAPEIQQVLRPFPAETGWSYPKFSFSCMIFGSNGHFDPWLLLARPIIPPVSNETQTGSLGAFAILSNELLNIIIDNLDDRSDIIALGLCCEAFWQLVKKHVERSYIEAAAPWAGTKIVFQGMSSKDLVEPLLDGTLQDSVLYRQYLITPNPWVTVQRLYWAHKKFESPISLKDILQGWLKAAEGHRGSDGISAARWDRLEKEMEYSELFPKDRSWVLRNWTTRETVSSKMNGISMRRSWNERAEIKFEDVLMMKICWSSYLDDYSAMILGKLDIHRGVWAGHRFDIVTSEAHSREENLGEWRDITRAVALEILALKAVLPRTVDDEMAVYMAIFKSLQSQNGSGEVNFDPCKRQSYLPSRILGTKGTSK
jgi:hypothetical protein